MKKPIWIFAMFAGTLALVTTSAWAFTGEQYAKDAKVTLPQARQAATKVFPGKIVKEELEKEKGGSGLRYSFDIRQGAVTHEVGIDAVSGRVLENSVEGPNSD
ncbi:MAG: PepSY domain-containing protein [Acidithiobacillus sp.]|jgi:uncharacterized membrane protein YkoI|uniref:Peptidase M4 n=2 Tax=Acidithiobacillus sulfuriphilus TaxID=1867749 RepID=A0A3M8QZE6_9PROT|nr:PepSY domain-containing protein [Acidithiobacillus sulfuriphilus]RNF60294.1 peptidase M4 [Acidithiobacillus sulfuriphilus]